MTSDLKPYPAYKGSGVEWLGEVPTHWEVRRLRNMIDMRVSNVDKYVKEDEEPVRLCNYVDVYKNDYINEQMNFMQGTATDEEGDIAQAEKAITRYRQTLNKNGLAVSQMFPAGTLVMTIAANIGDVAVLDFEACFPDSVVGFVPQNGVERDYLFYVFRAMKPELLREAPVNTQGNLNVDRIGSTRGIAVAPVCEQGLIVRQIEASTARLNTAASRASRQIELLHEYRTRLIADVVTGKLDVREAAAELPEVDPLAEDDLDGTIHDEENSSLDELDAAEEVPA